MGSLFFLVLTLHVILHTGKCFIFDDLFHIGGSKPLTSAAPIIDAIAHKSCPQYITRTNNLMFNTYSKHCFQINVDKKADWHTAKKDCESQGGYLATIKGWSDDSFIGFRSQGALGYHSGDNFLWIGLSDEETEGTFKWVTGELFLSYMYNSWDKHEPGQGDSTNCVVYNNDNDKWSVQNCTKTYPWICQFDPVKPTSTPNTTPSTTETTTTPTTTTTTPTTTTPTTTSTTPTTTTEVVTQPPFPPTTPEPTTSTTESIGVIIG